MLIAQISDTHIATANPDALSRIDDLARTVDSINAMERRPDVVLHTGDIAHDATAEDYRIARAELSRLKSPLYATIGNRDRRRSFFDAFAVDGYLPARHGFAQYAVDLGSLRLIAVDTFDEESALGSFCPTRAEDLRRMLGDEPQRPKLVFAHHPPLELPDMKPPSLQYRDAAEAKNFVDCLNACSNLIGVVAGHVHRARFVPLGRAMLSTVPCIAADLGRERVADAFVRKPIYHLHTIKHGRLTTTAVELEATDRVAA